MRFKVGDVILINDKLSEAAYVNVPVQIMRVEKNNYYIDSNIQTYFGDGYLFQEGSRWCDAAVKLTHHKTKLGKVLYGKRYSEM